MPELRGLREEMDFLVRLDLLVTLEIPEHLDQVDLMVLLDQPVHREPVVPLVQQVLLG